VLFPATDFGKAAAARLSARLGLGLTADCIDFSLEDDFYFFRAAMNQSVIAKIKCINCDIRMGTVKKDVFLPQERPAGNEAFAKVFIERFEYYSDKDLSRKNLLEVLDRVELQAKKRINIHEHPISFCLGRGVKQKDTKDRILDLAQRCSANVIGTRAAVEMGMIEKERQVGQSGRSVAPQIYVGFGVSGASQHIVGIKNAGLVVAVNNDKNAAIFDYADYQIIDNLESIVGEMDRLIPGNFA
jgi:electron transfer flavoprotein alpha subunit